MNPIFVLGAAALFAAACNLDTVILSMSLAARGARVTLSQSLILAALTTLITWLSLTLGRQAAGAVGTRAVSALGGIALVAIGLWYILDWLRKPVEPEPPQPVQGAGTRAWVALAAALAVNNAGIGAAAGVSGVSPAIAALANFLATLAALPLGRALGSRLAGRVGEGWALPLSGVLLVLLGLWEALG